MTDELPKWSPLPALRSATSRLAVDPAAQVNSRTDPEDTANALAAALARAAELEAENGRLAGRVVELTRLAYADTLTGLANRRCFEERLADEILRSRRMGVPLAVALCDVDSFKRFNDTFGHQRADDVLRRVGRVMRRHGRRGGDLVARYGGDEFALLLPATDCRQAFAIAERIRRAVSVIHGRGSPPPAGPITVAIGVTASSGTGEYSADDIILAADVALYRAKRSGANCSKYQPLRKRRVDPS